jgi:hypothetical protein
VGNGNIDVGKKTATRKPGQQNAGPSGICGAMAQQRCDSGRESAPQKFVQLVGYRDPKARSQPLAEPLATPVKRQFGEA